MLLKVAATLANIASNATVAIAPIMPKPIPFDYALPARSPTRQHAIPPNDEMREFLPSFNIMIAPTGSPFLPGPHDPVPLDHGPPDVYVGRRAPNEYKA